MTRPQEDLEKGSKLPKQVYFLQRLTAEVVDPRLRMFRITTNILFQENETKKMFLFEDRNFC